MSPGQREPRNVSPVDPNSIGAQIRRLRLDAGLTQTELAEALDLPQARVSEYELGKHRPSEDLIRAIAEVLKVSPALLFEASYFGGVLPIGTERRKRLKDLQERDWQMFDHVLDVIGDATPEQRAEFEQGFRNFLDSMKHFQKS